MLVYKVCMYFLSEVETRAGILFPSEDGTFFPPLLLLLQTMLVTQQHQQLLVLQQQGQNSPEIQAQTMQLMERAQILSQQQQSRRGAMCGRGTVGGSAKELLRVYASFLLNSFCVEQCFLPPSPQA